MCPCVCDGEGFIKGLEVESEVSLVSNRPKYCSRKQGQCKYLFKSLITLQKLLVNFFSYDSFVVFNLIHFLYLNVAGMYFFCVSQTGKSKLNFIKLKLI